MNDTRKISRPGICTCVFTIPVCEHSDDHFRRMRVEMGIATPHDIQEHNELRENNESE